VIRVTKQAEMGSTLSSDARPRCDSETDRL